jgi:hypothetical protein
VADDQGVSLPVRDEILGNLKDLVRVPHRSDDGDFVAHHVDELDRSRLFVDADDCQRGSLLAAACAQGLASMFVLGTADDIRRAQQDQDSAAAVQNRDKEHLIDAVTQALNEVVPIWYAGSRRQ